MQFETLAVSVDQHIATVKLNRPEKANAMNWQMWQDIRSAMQWADRTPEVRVVIVEGEGKHFTSGIDLTMMMGLQAQIKDDCDGRSREKLRALVLELQDTLSSIERCRKPVLAAIHNGCSWSKRVAHRPRYHRKGCGKAGNKCTGGKADRITC